MYLLLSLALLGDDLATAFPPIPLHQQTKMILASAEQGRAIMGKSDLFTQAMSNFDRQSRLQTEDPTDEAAYRKFAASHVRAWEPEEAAKLRSVIRSLSQRLEPFQLPLPAKIFLVKTNGQDEYGAPYCRENAIILPAKRVQAEPAQLERLLTHELFHVLSNQNAELRDKLYRMIGFQRCNRLSLPNGYAARKITNPDAPVLEHFITLEVAERKVPAVPVLFASVKQYEVGQGSFFKVMLFKLMEIEKQSADWHFKLENGKPVLLDPRKTASYAKQIGENTNYIIHPDEILADNFVLLVSGQQDVKTPRIIQQMATVLKPADASGAAPQKDSP